MYWLYNIECIILIKETYHHIYGNWNPFFGESLFSANVNVSSNRLEKLAIEPGTPGYEAGDLSITRWPLLGNYLRSYLEV